MKGQIGSEYLSQHWQRLSLSLRHNKNVFACYRSSLKFPANCVLKQQTHNLQLSDAVASFGFLPLREAVFFRWCLLHLTDFGHFRKRHVLYFTEKQKRSSFPNHHWTETQQISREKRASRVSNLRCGWSCQAISVTSVTLYSHSLERIRCRENGQSFSHLTRPAGVWGSRASHSMITLTALPAFRNRLFCSLVALLRSFNSQVAYFTIQYERLSLKVRINRLKFTRVFILLKAYLGLGVNSLSIIKSYMY